MSERAIVCKCLKEGREECSCEVPFIGNFAEADRRIRAGTLTGVWDEEHKHWNVTTRDIREAIIRAWDLVEEEKHD